MSDKELIFYGVDSLVGQGLKPLGRGGVPYRNSDGEFVVHAKYIEPNSGMSGQMNASAQGVVMTKQMIAKRLDQLRAKVEENNVN